MKLFKLPLFAIVLCILFAACADAAKNDKDPPITRVSLVGSAALGWQDGDGYPLPLFMTRRGSSNVFEFEGTLTSGGFKISCDASPSWGGRWYLPPGIDDIALTDGSSEIMRYSTSGDGGQLGAQWLIAKDAKYKITLNTSTKIITCEETGEAESQGTNDTFNFIYLIRCDEEAPTAFPMTQNGETWTITTTFSRNNYIKFNGDDTPPTVWGTASDPDTSIKWFFPSANGVQAAGTVNFRYGADSPNAWRITSAGEYTITLRPTVGTVTFEGGDGSGGETSSTLWLMYTKKESDLSAGDSWQMEGNNGTYTWQGALSGWYKFMASDTVPLSYGSGLQFGPNTNDVEPAGEAEDAFPDSAYAWYIPLGYYSITLKPTEETVTILKTRDVQAGDFEEFWVLGLSSMKYEGTNYWDAPMNTARRMTKQTDGTYTWAFNFSQDFRHIRIVCRDNGIIFYPNPGQLTAGRGDVQMAAGTEYDLVTHSQAKAMLITAGRPESVASIGMMSWLVGSSSGIYTVTINPQTMKIKFDSGGTPVDPGAGENAGGGNSGGETITVDTTTVSNIMLYGDGCATGWNTNPGTAGAVILFTQSPNVYAWKGPLKTGQLKFHNGTADIGAGAYTAVPGVGGTFPVTAGNGNVWAINASGEYIVWLDLNTNQVSFIVQ